MFDRIKYKNFAKIQLKNRFKIPVLMVLFTGLILIFLSIPQALSDSASINQEVSLNSFYTSVDIPFTQNLVNDISNILTFIVSCIFSMATAFVYIKMSKSPDKIFFSDFIEGFSLWKKGILSGLWQSLWIFLWSLLFFIPGIIKSYAYSQSFYLLTEYPKLSVTQALKVSMKITNGSKWELFILDLSFIPWILLGAITAGIAFFYVIPYYQMTKINAYHGLLKDAVEKRIISKSDLCE